MILPLNEPVSLARRMMTMQAFAPGRAIFGVGAGQYESEFSAFGSDLFRKRGKVTEEYLTLIRALHEGGTVTVPGEFRSVTDGVFHPGAQTVGRAPIWVAGNAPAAVRRAGRLGDGWICAARPLEDVRAGVQMVHEVVAGAGRDPDADFTVALSTTLVRVAPGRRPRDGGLHEHSRNISGGADEIADTLSGFAQAGVDHVILTFAVDELTDLKHDLEWFATAVAPAVDATTVAG
jgi:alkanesulfonate monooxygenase SsuD/methylene tetrahydromethanopterin reductase-like flavin-dependent oxidoreductase (luciferase family)